MTAITIDTYALITSLKDAGVPEQQAKAQIDAIAKFAEITREQIEHDHKLDDVATKRDIKELELKIEMVRKDIEIVRADLMREIEKSKSDLMRLGFLQIGLIVALLLKVLNMI